MMVSEPARSLLLAKCARVGHRTTGELPALAYMWHSSPPRRD